MATENIIGPEHEENQQQPAATPTRRALCQIFYTALTPYNAICRQFQPQEITLGVLESELNIINSPSDITSNPSDCKFHLGSSNTGTITT